MVKKIVILATCVLFSFGADKTKPPSLVNTVKVTKGVVNPLEEFIGTLEFSKKSAIASQSSGLVNSMTFQTGDIVKKGDILVTLDSKIVNSKIEQQNIEIKIAQLDLENSKKDYERNQKLIKKNSISQKTFDDSLFKYNSSIQNLNIAKNILDQLKIEKGYKTIKAPYDGIIIEKILKPHNG